jgi:hypothetical protein
MRFVQYHNVVYLAAGIFFLLRGPIVRSQSSACDHTDHFSGWERIKAANSAGVATSLDYVYYRIKRCTTNRPRLNASFQNLGVCHPGAQVQVKAPDGMPGDPKTGEVTAGYLVFEYFSDPNPIEVLFSVQRSGEIFENDYVNMQQPNLKSIKLLLMDDVLARLGKGPAISGTAEKAIVFPSEGSGSTATRTTASPSAPSNAPATPSIFFKEHNTSSHTTAKIASLSNKMADIDAFDPGPVDQTKLPTKPMGVAEFIKAGMWSDMQKQIDTRVYDLVPLDDQGNFLLINKLKVQSDQTGTDRIRNFYPGISYPVQLYRHYKIHTRASAMGHRG